MTEKTQALVDRLLKRSAYSLNDDEEIDAARAALTTLSRDLAAARACPDCQQPLACPAGTAERIAGLEAMHEETLTRAERAEADLAVARQERAEAQRGEQAWVEIAAQDARDAADRLTAAVRAARAETWERAIAVPKLMYDSPEQHEPSWWAALEEVAEALAAEEVAEALAATAAREGQ